MISRLGRVDTGPHLHPSMSSLTQPNDRITYLNRLVNLTTGVDSSINHDGAVLVHGLTLWNGEPTAAKNYVYSNAVVKHGLRRLGFYNDSPAYIPKIHNDLSFNTLPSDSKKWSFRRGSGD